jgi:cellulose synthase/poly-beta-1,6-N-acetylglucosamine synthase-like glycosyltransferase
VFAAAAISRRVGRGAARGAAPRRTEVAVLIPAHNEAAVLGNLLADLSRQTHPTIQIYVVSDNSSDRTAAVARAAGAICLERSTPGVPSTKHQALAHLWRAEQARLARSDAVLVLDADHRVPPDFVATLVACGAPVVQAAYREDLSRGNSIALLDAVSRAVHHQLCEAGRVRLGLSAMLVGSGMLFDRAVFKRLIETPTRTTVEDREWQLRLAREGTYVHWTDASCARSEPVDSVEALDRQRGRWLRGRWQLVRRLGGPLLREALKRLDLNLLDKLYDQVQPPRSVIGLALLGFAGLSLLPLPVPGLWPAPLLIGMALSFGTYFVTGLLLEGVPLRTYGALLRAPAFMVRLTLITLRSLISRRYDTWMPTRHRGLGE